MKGWMKGMLVSAGICVGVGCAICVCGKAMGGTFAYFRGRGFGITEMVTMREDEVREAAPAERYREDKAEGARAGTEIPEESPGTENVYGGGTEVREEGEVIRELDIQVTGGRVEVVADDSVSQVTVTSSNEDYRCRREMDDGKLEIRVELNAGLWSDFDYTEDEGDLAAEIRIPADAWFREVDLEVKGGLLQVERVAAEKLDLELAAGMLEVAEGLVEELDGECKAGELIYRGTVSREMDGECTAGRLFYEVEGSETDFWYELENSMGSILIDGTEQGLLRQEVIIDHPGAAKKAKLECKTGLIEIEFR